ncbi:ABC transporter permease subunit [Nocardioides sp. zg-DK7169]|uniref:ABC transporter permease n=1 Tax=Nocardioides sp. zg-DK7169 TaxID=2736600 RepID=UPI001C12F764
MTTSPAGAGTPAPAGAAPSRRRARSSRSSRQRELLASVGLKIAAIGAALLLWHWFALNRGRAAGVPTPARLVETAADMVATSSYWEAVGSTLVSAVIGFGLSVLIGVPLGLLIGTFKPMERSTTFVIDFGRTIPGVAILPVVLLLYGSTRTMVLILVMFSALWPILVQSMYAAQQLSPQVRQVAKSYRMDFRTRVRFIYVPSAMPFIMTGLRIAATISLLITISSEFLGGADGIGQRLFNSLSINDNDRMFVWVVTAALLGVLLNMLLGAAQRRVLWWHPSQRENNR